MNTRDNIIVQKTEKILQDLSPHDVSYDLKAEAARLKNKYNVIGFFAPYDNCGRTTAIVNIASELAKLRKTVCIVDLDFIRPDVFRYLRPYTKLDNKASIQNKIVNKFIPVTEVIHKSEVDEHISFVSACYNEHPSAYCSPESGDSYKIGYMNMFKEIYAHLSAIYDYVLIDMTSDITDLATLTAFRSCDYFLTFLDYSAKGLEMFYKDSYVLKQYGLPDILTNVVLSMIVEGRWNAETFSQMDTSMPISIVGVLPYSEHIRAAGVNKQIFTRECKNIVGRQAEYINTIRHLANIITNLEPIKE